MLKLNVNKEQAQEVVAMVEEQLANKQAFSKNNIKKSQPDYQRDDSDIILHTPKEKKEPKYIGYGGVEYYEDYAPLSWYIQECSEHCENHEEYFNQFTEEDLMEAEKKVSEYFDVCNFSGDIFTAYDIFLSAICYAKNYTIELQWKKRNN